MRFLCSCILQIIHVFHIELCFELMLQNHCIFVRFLWITPNERVWIYEIVGGFPSNNTCTSYWIMFWANGAKSLYFCSFFSGLQPTREFEYMTLLVDFLVKSHNTSWFSLHVVVCWHFWHVFCHDLSHIVLKRNISSWMVSKCISVYMYILQWYDLCNGCIQIARYNVDASSHTVLLDFLAE